MNKFFLYRLVIYIFIALVLRLVLLNSFPALLNGDSSGYLVASYHIRHASDFSDTSQRAVMLPGYPAFLALTAPLTGMKSTNIVLMQKALGLLGLFAGLGIGHLLRSPFLSECLIIFLAFNPVFLIFEHALSTETVFIFLLLALTVAWLFWLNHSQSILVSSLVGLLIGLTILTRANGLIYSGFLLLGGLFLTFPRPDQEKWTGQIKKIIPALFGMVFCLMILLGPWLSLNYKIHDRFGLVNFNNRNLLIYKALHKPLNESLPKIRTINQSLGETFGNRWLYRLKSNYSVGEAEEIAGSLYWEQINAHPQQHLVQMGQSIQNFYGSYHAPGNELATVLFWSTHLLPDSTQVLNLSESLMYQENPDFEYISVSNQTMVTNQLWSQATIFFLTIFRPLFGLLTGVMFLILIMARRLWQFSISKSGPQVLFIIGLAYFATVLLHVVTLTTNDRYAIPFDWIMVLLLIMSGQSLVGQYSTQR